MNAVKCSVCMQDIFLIIYGFLGFFRSGRCARQGGRIAFFGELLLLAVRARRLIGSDAEGIQHRAALMINLVTGRQPGGEGIAQVMRCPVERSVLQVRRESADMYQLRGKNGDQHRAVLIHEAIKPVVDVECLDSLMGADVLLLPAGFPPGRRVFPCHCGRRYSGEQQYP